MITDTTQINDTVQVIHVVGLKKLEYTKKFLEAANTTKQILERSVVIKKYIFEEKDE